MARWAWLATLLAVGCGADDAMPPPPVDAAALPPDATCATPEGRAYLVWSAHLLPASEGFDLDQDTTVDNALGSCPDAVRTSFNDGMDAAMASGEMLLAMLVGSWSEPPTPTDADLLVDFYHVYDAEIPPDPSNNLTGDAEFVIAEYQFDLQCGSANRADAATLVEGVLSAENDLWQFPLTIGTGALEFTRTRMLVDFTDDFAAATAHFGGEFTLCSLSGVPFPGEISGSILDAMVNDPAIVDTVHLDVDVDGDGLEQIVGDGVSVLRCLDGDGTPIEGADCPCHPAIADAYTFGMVFQLVSARIVGVR